MKERLSREDFEAWVKSMPQEELKKLSEEVHKKLIGGEYTLAGKMSIINIELNGRSKRI